MGTHSFIDTRPHDQEAFYKDFLAHRVQLDKHEQIATLKEIIALDAYYLFPYITLSDIYDFLGKTAPKEHWLQKAYTQAVSMIKKDGTYPKELLYSHASNQHIIRTLFAFAMHLWQHNDTQEAVRIFSYILHSDLQDPLGTRYSILGLLEGFESQEALQEKFMQSNGSLDSIKLQQWFEDKSQYHLDIFSFK